MAKIRKDHTKGSTSGLIPITGDQLKSSDLTIGDEIDRIPGSEQIVIKKRKHQGE